MALALVFLLAIPASPATATGTYTAVANGDWTSPATWAGGLTPPLTMDRSDFVEIPSGLAVTIASGTTVVDAGTIVNRGALVVAGTLQVRQFFTNTAASTLTVETGGTVEVGGATGVSFQNGGGVVRNHGALSVISGATVMNQVGGRFENDGLFTTSAGGFVNNLDPSRFVNLAGGSVSNGAGASFSTSGQLENHGAFVNEAGATFTNYGGLTTDASLTNHGTFGVNAGGVVNLGTLGNDGELTVYSRNGLLNLNGATLMNLGGGTLTVRGLAPGMVNQGAMVNASGATVLVWSSQLLNNHGTLTNHGLIRTQVTATLTNDANGVITNAADGTIENTFFSVVENGDDTQGGGTIHSYGTFINSRSELRVWSGIFHQYGPGGLANGASAQITIAYPQGVLIVEPGATLTNARFGSIANRSLLQTNAGGAIENHGAIANVDTGRLLNIGTVRNYCADGATVTGTVSANPVTPVRCTTTFTQTGIPTETWGVTVSGTRYTGSGPSIALNGLSGTVFYAYDTLVITGSARYDCVTGCTGSVGVGGTAAATYAVGYRVRYVATGCALLVPVPGDQFVAPGHAPSGSFPAQVYSTDEQLSTICVFVSDDRPAAISGPTTVTAVYETRYLLSVYNGGGGSQTYEPAGTTVTLTADAVAGMVFVGWQVDGASYPPLVDTITVTMDAPHLAMAVYQTPLEATQALRDLVDGMGLGSGAQHALDATLNAAIGSLGRGNTKGATAQLNAFMVQVRTQTGRTLTADQAALLREAAARIVAALGG